MMFENMTRVTLILVFAISATVAIKVPVETVETKDVPKVVGSVNNTNSTQNKPIYYASEESVIDSYLIPPDPHKPNAEYDAKDAPQTHLVPPSPDNKNEYFQPEDTEGQTDWLPILPDLDSPSPRPINTLRPPYQPIQILHRPGPHLRPHFPQRPLRLSDGVPILLPNEDPRISLAPGHNRGAKLFQSEKVTFPVPSRQLEAPYSDTSDFVVPPTEEQQIPAVNTKYTFKVPKPALELELPLLKPNENYNPYTKNVPLNYQLSPAEPTLALHLTPPKPLVLKYETPTKLFPKKYTTGFRPVPIPIAQFADDTSPEVPKAIPLKPFKPTSSIENEYYDAKKIYKFQQAQEKRKLKGEDGAEKHEEFDAVAEESSKENGDPDTSETIFRNPHPQYPQHPHAVHAHPGRNSYPAPLRAAPPRAPAPTAAINKAPPAPAERTEFRMHGMNGPHSYQFGYDTGKGKNRQFRFEERDNDGNVKGHYGYMEKSGKLRVVNYKSDPEHGFQADAPVENEEPTSPHPQ